MAGENDGSIIIDTELDNTGFQKGSEQLRKAIADTANAFDNFGDNVMNSFNKVIPLLQSIASSASQISAALTGTATQTEAATEKVVSSEQRVKQSAEDAAAAVNRQGEAASEFNGKVSNTQNTVSALEREVNSLSSGLQSVSNSAEMGFANGKAVLAFDTKLQELEQRLATAREHLAAFGSTQIPTEAYTSLSQQIEKAEQALFKLYDRRDDLQALGVKENSAQWQRLALQIENAEAQLARYERERDSLTANGGAFVNGSQTAEYARMETALNNAGSALDRNKSLIDQEALAQARLNVLTAQEAVAAASTSSEREAALERLRTAQQQLNDLAASMSNKPGNTEPSEESISGWQRFGAAIKSAASAALRMTGSLAKIGFGAIKKGISGIVGKLKEFTKQGHKSRSMAETLTRSLTSLKRMLITRIKRMFISSIFNSAKESLQSLAQFSDAFNQAMSNIKNSAKGLSANLAVSLGGLISAIEPVLTKIINMISTAISYLNAFFALLSGKATMTVAKKQTDNYAKSLGGAAGAAEELKRQVYGFDELNKRSSNDSGGGGGGGGAGDLFEEVPIDSLLPDSVKDFFQSIKDAIAAGNWREVGEIIASGLNSAMQVVDDWINNTFRPWGVKWAANVAEVLNGLTDGLDWNLLGKTIADGLNAIADIYNTFMDTYDFERLGKGLGDALNGLVDNIEWENIGKAFAQKWQALIELIHGFVHETNWANLGTGIGKAVQGWFDTIDWVMLADSITTGFNGLVTACRKAIQAIDWGSVGKTLADSITTLITEINWGEIAGLLSDAIIGLLDFAIGFIETLDWSQLAQSLWDGLVSIIQNVDWGGIINKAFELLGAAIGGAAALIVTLGENIWEALKQAWESVKTYFSDYIDQFGGDIIAGLWAGIKNALSNVGTWIKENIFQPFIDGFKKAFGINSPSTVMQEQGNFVIEGLLNGITETWNKITAFFSTALSNLKATLSNAWENIKTTASNAWSNIKTKVTNAFDTTKTSLVNAANNIKTNISNAWDNIKSKSSTIWDSVKSTVSTSFTNLKNNLQNTTNTIKSNLSTAWDNVKSTASTKWENVKSTITTKWNALKTTLNNTDWKSVGTNICNGIKNGIDAGWSWLKNTVSNLASNLLSRAKSALGIASPSKVFRDEVGKFIGLGLAEGISDTESTVVKTVKNLAEATVDGFDAEKLTLGAPASATVSGLDMVADKLSGIAEVFKEITSSILAIDGLRVPEIALGKVIPMRTKVDTSTLSNVELSGFDGFTSDMDEYMMEQSDVLKQILELLRRLKLHINMDDLTAAITAKQAATARSFGGV